jgi:hypothetical protein
LLHQQQANYFKELKTTSKTIIMSPPQKDVVECVGTLLVSSHDVQELSDVPTPSLLSEAHIPTPSFPDVYLKKRVSAGTLLVSPKDLKSPEEKPVPKQDDGDTSSTLRKRITNRLTGPAPPDSEVDTWAD